MNIKGIYSFIIIPFTFYLVFVKDMDKLDTLKSLPSNETSKTIIVRERRLGFWRWGNLNIRQAHK